MHKAIVDGSKSEGEGLKVRGGRGPIAAYLSRPPSSFFTVFGSHHPSFFGASRAFRHGPPRPKKNGFMTRNMRTNSCPSVSRSSTMSALKGIAFTRANP